MADPNEAKLFKQYLIETNAFQVLAEIFALLRKCNPKPADPIQFIRERLLEPTIDPDEYRCLRQNLIQLNEDVSQMKGDVAKMANMLSKIVPEEPVPVDASESIENNVGDESHISMLNDSSLIFDDTMNQTIISSVDLNATMQTDGSLTDSSLTDTPNASQQRANGSLDGFTMEIVEVDVVQQSQNSQEFTSIVHDEKTVEGIQIDYSNLNATTPIASKVNTLAASEPVDSFIGKDSAKCESNQLETAKMDVAENVTQDESPYDESTLTADGEFPTEDMQTDVTPTCSSTGVGLVSSTPNTSLTGKESKADINIEDLPIFMKGDDSQDLQKLPPFCGFEAHDVQQSENVLSNVQIIRLDTRLLACNDSTMDSIQLQVPNNSEIFGIDNKDKTAEDDALSAKSSNEKRAMVREILNEVVDNLVKDHNQNHLMLVDGNSVGERHDVALNVDDQREKCADKCIHMPKDDPETELFLSYC